MKGSYEGGRRSGLIALRGINGFSPQRIAGL
jgi:hypothetical protein